MNLVYMRGPFKKFVDSPYYSESELYGARSGLYGGCSNGVPPIHFTSLIVLHGIGLRPVPATHLFLGLPIRLPSLGFTTMSMELQSSRSG
jgi:hypothetical protein